MVLTVEASKQDCAVSFMNAFALFFPGICIYFFLLLFVFPFIALLTCNSKCYVSNSFNVVTQLLKTRLTDILKATVLIIIVNFSGKLELCSSKSYISMGAATGVGINRINNYE